MLLSPFTYHAPSSAKEAAKLYSQLSNVRLLAGGTFLLNNLKALKRRSLKTPDHIISLRKISELHGIDFHADKLVVKSMTSINDLFDSPHLKDNFEVLKNVCRNISTNPIRNMATVGGNLTSRYTWTELGAVCIALEGEMHFLTASGKEERISVENFFEEGGKATHLLTALSFSRNKEHIFSYQRVPKLSRVDVPLLAVCLRTTIHKGYFVESRVVVNNGVQFAQRDKILEGFLNGKKAQEGIEEEALKNLDTSLYDTRSNEYKQHMFRISLKKAIKELIMRGIS